jgi:hypothetical protein
MASIDEHILKAAKEIVVKFIECGRLSPTGFAEAFQSVYKTVDETVKSRQKPPEPETAARIVAPAPKPPGPVKKQ